MTTQTPNKLEDFQFGTLSLAGGFCVQADLAAFRAAIFGQEPYQILTTVFFFALGCWAVSFIGGNRRFSFSPTGGKLLAPGFPCSVAIALFSFVSFPVSFFLVTRHLENLIYLYVFLIGILSYLPHVRIRYLYGPSAKPLILASALSIVASTLLGLGIAHFGYMRTSEYLGALILLTSFCILFWNGRRNGWVAFTLFLLSLIPFAETYWKKPPADLTSSIQGRKVALMELNNDRKFPGIAEHALFVDGLTRFNGAEEQNFYHCLVNVSQAASETSKMPAKSALVIGGGTGLAARNLLTFPRIKSITLVDPDPVGSLSKLELQMRIYNLDSLKNSKVTLYEAEPRTWVTKSQDLYDLIYLDWPIEKRQSSKHYFSTEFLSRLLKRLNPQGFVTINAGNITISPDQKLFTPMATALRRAFVSLGYHAEIYLDSKDNEAFVLATENTDFDMKSVAKKASMIPIRTRRGRAPTPACYWPSGWKETSGATFFTLGSKMDFFKYAGNSIPEYAGPFSVLLPD